MSVVWDIAGAVAIGALFVLAFGLILLLGAVDEERWWRRLERDR